MTATAKRIVNMLDLLPEKEQDFACEVLRKLVLAWDPDFTKTTPGEARNLQTAREQFANGEYYTDDEIDWDNLEIMNLDQKNHT